MKRKGTILAACVAAVAVIASCGKDEQVNNPTPQLSDADRTFMTQASIANSAEIDAANLALTKATNAAVMAFAQHMIAEHNAAQTDLKNLGTTVGYAVKDTIDPAHMALTTQLSSLEGRAFDSTYIYAQRDDHQTVLSLFQTEISSGQSAQVKSYASTYQPHIQEHFNSSDSIAKADFPR